MKQLSIIIVTYNSEKDIYDCLDSVFQFSDIPLDELEVIVVDNNSSQADVLESNINERYGERVTLIHNDRNGGYGQGNNIGLRHASAPVAMIMNPDVRLYEPVFRTAIHAFQNEPSLSMYGMKQMTTLSKASSNSFCCTSLMNGYLFSIINAVCTRLEWYIPRFMYLQGSCFFVRIEMFYNVGLYDEDIFMYGEEDDIHYRIGQTYGYHMVYNPKLHYLHLTGERKPDLNYQKKRLQAVVLLNEKKEHPRRKTILNYLRNNRLLLLREHLRHALGKKDDSLKNMYSDFCQYLKQQLAYEKGNK